MNETDPRIVEVIRFLKARLAESQNDFFWRRGDEIDEPVRQYWLGAQVTAKITLDLLTMR